MYGKIAGKVLSVTPTISAALYAANAQVGGANLLKEIATGDGEAVMIDSVVVVDKAKQSAALDLLFFDSLPALTSADTQAFNLPSAEMAKCVGVVSLVAGDYVASASNSVATKRQLELVCKPAAGKRDLYVVAVTRGTPTYVSTSDLIIKVGAMQ